MKFKYLVLAFYILTTHCYAMYPEYSDSRATHSAPTLKYSVANDTSIDKYTCTNFFGKFGEFRFRLVVNDTEDSFAREDSLKKYKEFTPVKLPNGKKKNVMGEAIFENGSNNHFIRSLTFFTTCTDLRNQQSYEFQRVRINFSEEISSTNTQISLGFEGLEPFKSHSTLGYFPSFNLIIDHGTEKRTTFKLGSSKRLKPSNPSAKPDFFDFFYDSIGVRHQLISTIRKDHISNLPKDIIKYIASFLDPIVEPIDIARLRRTSKFFHSIFPIQEVPFHIQGEGEYFLSSLHWGLIFSLSSENFRNSQDFETRKRVEDRILTREFAKFNQQPLDSKGDSHSSLHFFEHRPFPIDLYILRNFQNTASPSHTFIKEKNGSISNRMFIKQLKIDLKQVLRAPPEERGILVTFGKVKEKWFNEIHVSYNITDMESEKTRGVPLAK